MEYQKRCPKKNNNNFKQQAKLSNNFTWIPHVFENKKQKTKNKNRMSNSIIQDRVANLQMTASMKVNAGVRLLIAEESVGEL